MLLAACVSMRWRPPEGPLDEARVYLQAWAAGDFAALRREVAEPPASLAR